MLRLLAALATLAAAAPRPDFDASLKRTRAAFCAHDLKAAQASLPALKESLAALPKGDGRRVSALRAEADVLGANGDEAGAEAALDQAEEIVRAKRHRDERLLADILFQRASSQEDADDHAAALRSGNAALPLFRRSRNRGGEAADLVVLGLAAGNSGRHAEAIEYDRRAVSLFKRLGSMESAGSAESNEAAEMAGLGRNSQAELLYLDAIALTKKAGGTRSAGLSYIAGMYADFLKSLGPARAVDEARWRELAASAAPPRVDVARAGQYSCSDH